MLRNLDQIGNLSVTSTAHMTALAPDGMLDAILAMQVTIA